MITKSVKLLQEQEKSTIAKVIVEKFSVPTTVKNILANLEKSKQNKKQKVCHKIDTGDTAPIVHRCRKLNPAKLESAKDSFKELMKQGYIEPSKSSWSSPLHLVPKQDGTWRICGDYRALNRVTKPDRYPLPHLMSFSEKLHGKTIFSKIDLLKAYHQIPMDDAHKEKTAIVTPFGLFQYKFLPFGLRNAPATFQRYMDELFREVDFVFVYLDDILIFSENEQKHESHLRQVFQILHDHDIKISFPKCEFMKSKIEFLGHLVTPRNIQPIPEKIQAIENFPKPATYDSLRRFIGMTGFYRRFIANFSDITFPLTEMLREVNQKEKLNWTTEAEKSFQACKKALKGIVGLAHLHPTSQDFQLVTDASQVAVGAALHQIVDGCPTPISFFSKKLTETQRKYSTYDRELLAVYLAVLHFKHLIEGQNITLLTDHKPLLSGLKAKTEPKSERQQRQMMLINEYISDFHYIRGADNIVADCLSRDICSVELDAFDLQTIADAQEKDEEFKEFKEKLTEFITPSKKKIWCEVSSIAPRPFISKQLRKKVFEELHNIAHPGVKASLRLIKARYFWPNMDRDIRSAVKLCLSCQQSKINRHTKSPIQSFELPVSSRFQYVHMDIVGPLPVAQNIPYRYLLTIIDRATRWVEAIPLIDITALSVATAFLEQWISRFGVPLYVVTDQGRQFESEFFKQLSKMIGFTKLRISPYHPQANGYIERVHRTLKSILKARKTHWLKALPFALLGLRAHPNTDTGCSPFTYVTGTNILIPPISIIPINKDMEKEYIQELVEVMQSVDFTKVALGSNHSMNSFHIDPQLNTCSHVWMRIDRVLKPLESPYEGPFEVVERYGKTFKIRKASGKEQVVSIDRLKPVVVSERTRKERNQKTPLDKTCNQETFSHEDIQNKKNLTAKKSVRFNLE